MTCPRAVPSLQAQELRLQFCRRQVFHRKHRNQAAVLPEMNRCGSFQLFSAPHSLFSIRTDLKRSEKIPGIPTWKGGEWIWLTGPSRLHRNSLHGLNISFIKVSDQIRDQEIPIILLSRFQFMKMYLTTVPISWDYSFIGSIDYSFIVYKIIKVGGKRIVPHHFLKWMYEWKNVRLCCDKRTCTWQNKF